jgi:hypothetical protein
LSLTLLKHIGQYEPNWKEDLVNRIQTALKMADHSWTYQNRMCDLVIASQLITLIKINDSEYAEKYGVEQPLTLHIIARTSEQHPFPAYSVLYLFI